MSELFHFVCACGAKLDVLAIRCCGCARRSKTGMVLKHALTMGNSLVVEIGLQAKKNWLIHLIVLIIDETLQRMCFEVINFATARDCAKSEDTLDPAA